MRSTKIQDDAYQDMLRICFRCCRERFPKDASVCNYIVNPNSDPDVRGYRHHEFAVCQKCPYFMELIMKQSCAGDEVKTWEENGMVYIGRIGLCDQFANVVTPPVYFTSWWSRNE